MSLIVFWTIAQTLSEIATIATTIFVDFYIWESTHNFQTLLEYNLGLFLAIPIGALMSGFLSEYTSLRVGYIFSKLTQVVFLTLLLVLGKFLFSSIFTFGILSGLIVGISIIAEETTNLKLPEDRALATVTAIVRGKKFINIIFPFIFAYLIQHNSNSFGLPFIIAIITTVLVLIFAPLVDFPESDQEFSILDILTFPGTNPEKSLLIKANFFHGIRMGLVYSLIGVLTLNFVGSLVKWSFISFGLGTLSIIFTTVYRRLSIAKDSLLSLGVAAVIFLLASGYFVYNFSLFGIIIYLLGLTFLDTFFGFGFSAANKDISQLDGSEKDLRTEYIFLEILCSSVGMILPVALLAWLRLDLNDPFVFQLLIIVVGVVPFVILNMMRKSFYLTRKVSPKIL